VGGVVQSPRLATTTGAASSFTLDELNKSSTSYLVADSLRLFPDDATVATQAPSLALMPAFVNAVEHAVSSSTAVSLADSLCTFTPAIAASARSLHIFLFSSSQFIIRLFGTENLRADLLTVTIFRSLEI
jgi:hypothetical protein